MATFQKLSNGNILYTDNSNNVHAFSATMNILPHPTKDDSIIITDDANNIEFDKGTIVKVSDVTSPVVADRNDLITQLATTFFFKSLDFAKIQNEPTDGALLKFNSQTGEIESDDLVTVFAKLNGVLTDGALLKYNATTRRLESVSTVDANTLTGKTPSETNTNDSIAKRDSSGNLVATDFIIQ